MEYLNQNQQTSTAVVRHMKLDKSFQAFSLECFASTPKPLIGQVMIKTIVNSMCTYRYCIDTVYLKSSRP